MVLNLNVLQLCIVIQKTARLSKMLYILVPKQIANLRRNVLNNTAV
jgi:hypothetical protein